MAKKEVIKQETDKTGFALGIENYKYLGIGLVAIIIGFILMAGGGTDDPNKFSHAIFSFRRITLAPLVLLFGYIFIIYAIMKRPKKNQD